MSFRVNFFSIPYIVVLLLLIAFVSVFNEVIYSYFAANFEINGIIVGLFIFCNIWILGSMAYYNRSAKLLSKILGNIGPVVEKKSVKKLNNNRHDDSIMTLQSAYPISGTLFDNPVFSSMLAKLDRKNKIDVTKADADEIAQAMIDNAARVLAPSKFLAGIFVLAGLIGTFFGLLETIGGVANALGTLSSGGLSTDITKFIGLLSNPLQGMSTAFSASLFGLTSALISNFGNHSAWQKVLFFTQKVRNYLITNTGVFGEDPTKITVRDLLISLEESFDLLYRGITNRLEDLNNNIATMGSVIVKTHERQEKMLRVILKDHELMEQFWKKFLLGEEGVMAIVDEVCRKLSIVLPESLRKVFAPVLEDILDSMDRNNSMIDRSLSIGQESLKAQNHILDLSGDINKILGNSNVLLARAGKELVHINDKLNLDQVASLVAEGNDIKNSIANLVNASNDINVESNNLSNEILNKTSYGNTLSEELVSSLNNANSIVLDIRSINQQATEALFKNNALSEEIINKQNVSNNLNEGILQSTINSNAIESDTLLLLGNMFEENNYLTRGIIDEVSKVVYHNENMIRILDERFGMIIAFSSDILNTANNSLSSLNSLNDQIMNYYKSMFFRVDYLVDNLNQVNTLLANNKSILDVCAHNTGSVIQRLDATNGLVLDNLQSNSKTLSNVENITEVLNNLSSTLFVSYAQNIEKLVYFINNLNNQMSSFINSFSDYKEGFNKYVNCSISNAQYLSNSIALLNNNLVDNIKNIGVLLNDITASLGDLNNITIKHKDLTDSIKTGMGNLLNLNNSINSNILSLGGVFDNSVSKIVQGINAINMASANYSESIKELLSSIVNNLTSLAEINKASSEKTDILTNKLDNSIIIQENLYGVNDEIKNILINTDNNVKGVGEVLTSVHENTESITHKLEDINVNNKENVNKTNNTILEANKNIERVLIDIATLVNNLNIIYEQQGSQVQDGLNNIEKGIISINNINSGVLNFIKDIKNLLNTIENATSNTEDIKLLNNIKEKLDNLQSLKEVALNEFENTIKPALTTFNENFVSITDYLSTLSNMVIENKDTLSSLNNDIGNKIAKDFVSLNTNVNNLNNHLNDISQILSNQDIAFENIIEQLSEFKNLVHNFSDIPQTLSANAAAIADLGKAINLLEKASENTNIGIGNFSENISVQIQNLSNIVKILDDSINEEADKIISGNNKISNSIVGLTQEISTLGKGIFSNEDKRESFNKEMIQEINKSFDKISVNVNEMKQLISNNIGTKLINELKKISESQTLIGNKIEHITPYINKLIKLVNDINFDNFNNDFAKAINSLEKINSTDITNSNKLDLLLKAADTLVSEMLNSRNVSQAILDIIAELGGFKNINN